MNVLAQSYEEEDITLEDFENYNEKQQQEYIQGLNEAAFADPANKDIADSYFIDKEDHINDNKNSFKEYLKAEGLKINSWEGNVVSYDKKGLIETELSSIKVSDFDDGKYSISVNEYGAIYISPVKGIPQNSHYIEGNLKKDESGNFQIEDGVLDMYNIKGGKNIIFNNDGTTEIEAEEYAGIKFDSTGKITMERGPSKSPYDTITFKDSKVKDYTVDYTPEGNPVLTFKGNVKIDIDDYDNFMGGDTTFRIKEGDSLSINDVEIKAIKNKEKGIINTVAVHFDGSNLYHRTKDGIYNLVYGDVIDDNYVRFTPSEIKIEGDGKIDFKVDIPTSYIIGNVVDSETEVPKLNAAKNGKYFVKGDEGDNVKIIQNFLIKEGYLDKIYAQEDQGYGNFGLNTENALKEWQYSKGLTPDGTFGKGSLKNMLGYNPSDILSISPDNGKALIYFEEDESQVITEGNIGIDFGGNNNLIMGNHKFITKDRKIMKDMTKQLGDVFGTAVRFTLRDSEGNKLDEYEYDPSGINVEESENIAKLGLRNKKYTGIAIDRSTQELYYYENGKIMQKSDIAVGSGNNPNNPNPAYSTPEGNFEIAWIEDNKGSGKWATEEALLDFFDLGKDEGYYDSTKGEYLSVYGPGFIVLKNKDTGEIVQTGIHGTNIIGNMQFLYYNNIGKPLLGQGTYISHGCMRVQNDEWIELRERTKAKTPVKII